MSSNDDQKSYYLWWLLLFIVGLTLAAYFPVGQKLNLAIAPLVHVVQAPARWYAGLSLWFEDAGSLQARYSQLQIAHAQQQAVFLELTTLRTENQQFRRLLKISQTSGYAWQVARVISRSPEEESRGLTLASSHAKVDDIIVSDEGLVGLVADSAAEYAVVRTILDASIAVPVTMQGSRLAGLVRGDGRHLVVDFVPADQAVKAGDILLTSGAGGLFPAGIAVARVQAVKVIQGDVFVQVSAKPIASWQRDAWLAIATPQH